MKVNLKRGKVQITLTDAEVQGELLELLKIMAWDRERSPLGWQYRQESLVEFYARLAGIVDGHAHRDSDSSSSPVWRDDAVKMGGDYTEALEAMCKAMSAMRMNSRAAFDLKRRTKRERKENAEARKRAVMLRAFEPGLVRLDPPAATATAEADDGVDA